MEEMILRAVTSALLFIAVFMLARYGWPALKKLMARQEQRFDTVLNRELLLEINPRTAMWALLGMVVMVGLLFVAFSGMWVGFIIGSSLAMFIPPLVLSHLEEKRRLKLEEQLVDGVTSLASGVRAGLTLIQSIELLVKNHTGPIRQEFEQLLREYNLGVELQQAMNNTSNRIGSSHYRLLFSAIAAHRQRGGDVGRSLDRIAHSVREIQRLEGKLRTMTAQGRAQARFMAAMPLVILAVLYLIDPGNTSLLLTDRMGQLILLIALGMIVVGFLWIRRIMDIDI